MTSAIKIERVHLSLPPDFSALRTDAAREGHNFIERLVQEWADGTNRFCGPGEGLQVARVAGALAGIGGMTIDPFQRDALRMRRFYVRPAFRRRGIARVLARALFETAGKDCRRMHVNAGTDRAAAFWEHLGFRPAAAVHHSHVMDLNGNPVTRG